MNIKDKDALLNKAFGLSLSDQYWFNPVNTPLSWSDINFFENNFNGYSYYQIIFKDQIIPPSIIDFFSPNNTSDGMLKKAWIIENNKRILVKGSYKGSQLEPFNEVLASKISDILGLSHVDYTLDFINNASVSKCECFIQPDIELITAYSILKYYNIDTNQKNQEVYENYLQILEKHHIVDAKEKLTKMFILDYLLVNQDRHLGNFGIIRNVETLEWIDLAPNFDNGQSLYSQNISYFSDFNYPKGKFFFDNALSFETILKIVLNNTAITIDFESLYQLVDQWNTLLTQYQEIINIDDEIIQFLVLGFKTRIDCLKEHF